MPFGLQLKSVIVGMLIAYLVLPAILGMVGNLTNRT